MFSARTCIKGIFALQLGIAAALMAQDFSTVLPNIRWPSTAPDVSQPVTPGDQTRRFRPDDFPRPTSPGIEMPGAADMPSRLTFQERPDGSGQITGQIKDGDARRFTEWLDGQSPAPERLWFQSPGGSVKDALEIGRLIRERNIETAMEAATFCLSACPYMLVGGITRSIDATAKVGVHQSYYGENTILPAFLAVEDIQRSQAETLRYLIEMGVDLKLMEHALATPPDEIYILLPEELTDYAVATEIIGG